MIKVSVVVTNYNYGHYLYECVSSIRKQSFQDFELIIVDDASTDGSSALVPHLADKCILFRKNQGTTVASNAGIRLASGEFCVLVNADDRIGPDFLKKTLEAFDGDPSLAFVYTDFWHFGKDKDGKEINNGVVFPQWDLENLKKFNYILCSAVFRKSVFDQLGGFQVDFGMEDYDLWLRMGLAGYVGKKVEGYLYEYRAHDKNRTHGIDVHRAVEKIKTLRLGDSVSNPKFSLCYATRRPWLIHSVVQEWLKKSIDPTSMEVVVCVDSDDSLSITKANEISVSTHGVSVVIQDKQPHNCVKAWNLAASKSKGQVLIMISDDFVPPEEWDQKLLDLKPNWPQGEFVVRVNDCNNSAVEKPFTLPILTRLRYERFGYVFWPEYESMFSDTEFGEKATLDGVVISAKTLLFEHVHHSCFKRSEDDIDRQHSSLTRWAKGQEIYLKRKAKGFTNEKSNGQCLDIANLYLAYVRDVKIPVFTVSVEASMWLEEFLRESNFKSALDIGANFSSVVMALRGLDTTITDVNSCDMDKTHEFAKSLNLSLKKIGMEFDDQQYDVVFVNAYDANSPQRFDLITKTAPNLVRDGGVLMLHDGHFINVRKAMDQLTFRGWKSMVPDKTIDRYDRFWMILTR